MQHMLGMFRTNTTANHTMITATMITATVITVMVITIIRPLRRVCAQLLRQESSALWVVLIYAIFID